jgi:hypothetical protein
MLAGPGEFAHARAAFATRSAMSRRICLPSNWIMSAAA